MNCNSRRITKNLRDW